MPSAASKALSRLSLRRSESTRSSQGSASVTASTSTSSHSPEWWASQWAAVAASRAERHAEWVGRNRMGVGRRAGQKEAQQPCALSVGFQTSCIGLLALLTEAANRSWRRERSAILLASGESQVDDTQQVRQQRLVQWGGVRQMIVTEVRDHVVWCTAQAAREGLPSWETVAEREADLGEELTEELRNRLRNLRMFTRVPSHAFSTSPSLSGDDSSDEDDDDDCGLLSSYDDDTLDDETETNDTTSSYPLAYNTISDNQNACNTNHPISTILKKKLNHIKNGSQTTSPISKTETTKPLIISSSSSKNKGHNRDSRRREQLLIHLRREQHLKALPSDAWNYFGNDDFGGDMITESESDELIGTTPGYDEYGVPIMAPDLDLVRDEEDENDGDGDVDFLLTTKAVIKDINMNHKSHLIIRDQQHRFVSPTATTESSSNNKKSKSRYVWSLSNSKTESSRNPSSKKEGSHSSGSKNIFKKLREKIRSSISRK